MYESKSTAHRQFSDMQQKGTWKKILYGIIKTAHIGKTPSESALIKVDGKNRWKTIIQNASIYKENLV